MSKGGKNLVDMIGKRFGLLTVIDRDKTERKGSEAYWICRCECGRVKSINGCSLRKGATKSCGSGLHKIGNGAHDITGNRYGYLVALRIDYSRGSHWICKCDCGKEVSVDANALKTGNTRSCGCQKYVMSSAKNRKHGMSKSKLYGIWSDIKARCYNPNNASYDRYGARGIGMCDEWKNDPSKFIEWSLNNGYFESDNNRVDCSIDRIDNDKGYSPNNCRWVDIYVQAYNKRRTIILTYNDETHTIREWSEKLGIKETTIRDRYKRGLSVGRILGFEQK